MISSVIPSEATHGVAQPRDLFSGSAHEKWSLRYASLREAPVGMTE
jgi:hypothetical protein